MGCKTIKALWDRIDGLEVTPTEALVLTALAHYASDDFGYCHPRHRQMEQKCHLGHTATVASLGSLKRKGLVHWTAKPKHPNEYSLPFGAAGGAGTHGKGNGDSSAENGVTVEGTACTLLAYTFATLLADRRRRTDAFFDYVKPVKRYGFIPAFRLFHRIKAQLRELPDDVIHARILRALADPEAEGGNA